MYQKSGSPFLYDDTTNELIGIKDADYSERLMVTQESEGASRILAGGRVAGISVSSEPVVHDLPLTHSLLAATGANLTFARTGASAVVDCYGSLQIISRSNEARFWGARRVENKVLDDTFTSGWTNGANVTKAVRSDVLGPYKQRRNVYEFTRSSGSGAVLTFNSASYRPGQHTFSIWLGGDGVTQFQLQLQLSSDSSVVATVTVTPPAQGLSRYTVFGTIPSTANHRFQILSATSAAVFRAACAQVEWTHGQDGAPNDYVPRGSAYDADPWRGAGVDGVEYFDTLNPWSVTSGLATKSTVVTPIDADTLKGLMMGPTRVNKFYESRDIGAASWTLTGATAAGTMEDSTLLGTSSLRKLEEDTSNGVHSVTQDWKGTLPSSTAGPGGEPVMITIAAFVETDERSILKIGFTDKAGASKFAYVDAAKRKVLSETGDVYKTHITQVGDLVRVSFTDTCGDGASAPVGFFRLATAAGTDSYVGVSGSGMYFGGLSFERTDHACIYLADTATSTPAGTGDDTDALVFDAMMGNNGWTVTCDVTTMYDSDSQSKSSWSYNWYATQASNIRWGCGIRPGAYGGAVVEDYVKNPVFDCYAGPDGTGVPQVNPNTGQPQEIFDVCNALHITPAMQTVTWQIALHKASYDGASNIAMHVGATQGVLDSNGRHLVSKVPTGVTCRIGYKLTPIDEKCIKHFKVLGVARTWARMVANVA